MTGSDSADSACATLPASEDRSPEPSASEAPELVELQQQRIAAFQESESAARQAVSLLVSILNSLPVGVTVQSENGRLLFSNPTAAELYGDDGAISDEATQALIPTDDGTTAAVRAAATVIDECVAGPQGEHAILRASRSVRIRDRPLLLSASIDFTQRKRVENELSKRAYFDDLTGLPNRTLIQEHVEQLLACTEPEARFALAFIDIDNFKRINDYYTHAIGDALLVQVAKRVTALVRPSDIMGRISGDEFLLVIRPIATNEELAVIVERILKEIREPFLIEGFEILTSASIGVSVFPDHGTRYEMLRRAADTAMYRIKAGAKGGAAMFNSDMGRDMSTRMAQEQRLRLAVRDGRFCCAFQPKVDIRTQEVVGVEALIRLRDEDGMIQGPGEFIGLALELGLINDLTHLALGQDCSVDRPARRRLRTRGDDQH